MHLSPANSARLSSCVTLRRDKPTASFLPAAVTQSERGEASSLSMEEEEIHLPVSYKSGVWQHFGFYKRDGQAEKSNAICKMCHAAFKYTGSTTNMSCHLKQRHGVTVIERSQSLSTPALAVAVVGKAG